jgi:hypothetical protein
MTHAPDSNAASAFPELDAAQRLIADPHVPPHVAAVHLRRVWMRLAGSQSGTQSHSGDELEPARAMAHEAVDARLDPSAREAQRQTTDWLFEAALDAQVDRDVGTPDRAELLAHIQLLRALMGGERTERDPVMSWGLGFLLLVVLALAAFGVWGLLRGPTGPWQVQWFPERDFTGKVRVEYVRQVDFDWGKGSPSRGIPKDDWSARFETCLEIDDDTKIRFKLTSDDGSRLFVDGKKVVDNWGDHGPRARMGTHTFEPGVYHLQIDYYEARHGAKLELEVSFDDDGDFAALGSEWIRQPRLDEDAPCD